MERASSPYSHNSIPESLEEKYHTNYIYDQAPRVECDDQFHRPFTYFDHVNRTPYEDLEAKSSGSSITFLSNSIPSQEFFFPYQCDKTGQPKRMDVSKGFYRREHKTDKRILWEKYRRQRLWKKLNDRVRYNRALLPEIIGKIKSSESLTYTEADLNRIRIPRYEGPERQLHLQSLPDIYKHVRGIKPSKKFKRQPLKTGLWPSVRHFEDSEGSIWSFQAEDDVKSHPIKNATSKEIPMKRDTKLSIGQPRSSIYLSVDGFNESKDGKDGKLESIASSKPESTTKPEEVPTEQKWDVCSNRETPSNSSSDSDLDISSMTGEPSTVDDSSVTSESIELPLLVTNRHIYSSSSIEQLNKHKNTETSKEHLEMCLKEYLVNFTEKEVEEVYRKIMSDAHSSKSVHLQEENLPSGAERKEPVCPKLAQSVADDKGYKKKVSCTHFSQLPDESTVESISSQEERTVQFPHPLTINDLNNMILVDTEKIPDFESHLPPDKINLPSLKRKLFSHKRKHAFSLKNSKNMKYSLKITHKLVPEPFSGRVFSHKKPLFTLDLEDVIVQSAYRPINQYAGEIVTRLQLPIEQMRLLDDQSSVTSISEDEQGEENYVLKLRKEVQRREMQRAEMRLSPQYTTKYLGPKMGTTLLKRQQLNRITKEYTHQVLDRSDRKVYSRDLTVAMRDGRLKFKMGIAGTSEYLDEADDTIEFFTMPPIFHTTFELDANAQWIEPNAERRSSEESADINLFRSVLTEQYEAEAKSAEEAKQDSKGVNFKSTKRKSISKSPSSYPNENDSLHGQMSVTKNVSDDFIQNVGISKGLKQRAPMPMHCWIKAKKDIRKLLKFKIERPQQTEDDEESYVFKKKRFSHKTSVMNLRQFIREQEFNYPLDIALETEKLYENMKIDSFYDSDNNLQFYYPYDSHLSYKPGVVNIDYMALLFEERQRSIASSSEAEEDEGPSDNDSQWNVRKVYHQEAPILSDRDSESFDEDVILICDCPDATKIGVESVGSDSDKSVSLMFKMFMRDNPGQGFEDAYTTCRANIFKTIEGTTKGGDTEQIVFMADKKDSDEKLYTGDKDNDNDSDESNVSVELKKNMRLKYIEKLRGASVGEIAKKQVAADEKSKMGVMKQITKSAIKKIGIADDSGTIVSSTDSTIGMSQAHLSGNYSISIDPLDNAATQEVEVEKPFIHEEFVKAKSSSSSMSTGEYRIENGLPVKQVIKKRLNRGYNTLLRVLVKTEMTHLNRMRFKSTFNKPYKCLNIWSRTNRAIKTFQKKSEKPLDKNAVLPLSEFPPLVSNSQIAETEIAKKFNENIGSFEVQVNNIINKNTFGNIQSLPESALVPKVPTKEPKIVNLRWHYFPAMQAKRFEGYEKGPIADKLRESFDQDLLYSLVKVLEVPGQETNDQPRPAGREDRLSVVSSSEIIVQEVVAKPGRKKTEIQHGGGISLVDDPKIVETYLKEMQRMDKLDKRSKTGEVKAKGKRPFSHIKNFARHSLFMQATEHADNEKLFKWNDCIKCWIAKFSDIRNLIVPYLRMERRNINQMVIKCSHENDNSQFNSTIDMEAKKKSAQYNMDWIFSKKMRFPTLSSLYKIQDKQLFCVKNPYHEPYLYKIKEMHLGMKIGRYLKKEHGIQAQDIIPPEMILSYKHEKSIFMYPGIHFLPLEIFDNQSYDIRSREEWMELGWSRDEHCFGVPAIAFVPSGNYQLLKQRYIHHFWTDVIVYDYDPKNDCFAVFPCSATHGPYLLKRIYICFIGENPVVYCDRIASAVALRNHAEYQLRFRFFKDSVDISVDEKYEEMSSRLKQILEETASKQPNLSDVSTELMAQWNDMFRKVVISKLVDKFVASGKGGEIYYLPIEDPRPYQWGANKTFDCNEDESFKEDLSESDVNMVEDDSEECPTDANPFLVYKKGESAPPCTCKRILTRDMDSETIHKSTHVSEKQVMQLRKQHELVCGMKGGLYQNKKCLCFVGEKFRKGIGPDGKPTATWATKETLLRFILQKHTDVLYEKMYPGHVEKKTLFKTTMGKIRRRGKTVLIKSKSKKPVNIDISISTQGESATGDTLFNLDQLSIVRTNYKKMAKKLEDVNNEVYLADVGLNHTCSELSMDSVRNVSRQPSPCYDGYDPNGKHSDSNTSKEQAHSITPEAVQSNSAINQHGTNVVDDTNKTLTKDVEQYHWKTHSEIDVATMSEYDPLQRQPSIPSVDRFDLAGYMKKKRAKEKTLICKDRVERSSRESVQLRSRPDTRNSSEMNKPRRYRKEKVMKSIVRRNNEAIDNEQKAKMKNVRIDTTTKTNSFTKLSRNTESPPRKNISKHRQHEEVQTNDDNYTNQQTDVLNYHAQTSHNIPKMAKSEKRSKGLKRISVLASPFTKRAMRSKSNIDNLLSQIEIDPVIEVLINPDNSVKSIIRSAAEDVLDNNTQVKTMKRGKLKDRKGKHLLKMQYKEEINNTLSKLQDKLTARLQNLNYSSEGTEDREIESNGPSDVKRQEVKYNSSTPVRLPSVITTELESQKISSEDSLPTFHPRESAKAIGLLGPSSLLRDQQQSTPKKYTAPLLKHPTKTKEREVEPKKKLNKKVPTVKKKRTVKVQLKNNLPDKTRDTETCKTTTHKDTKQKGNQSKSCKQEDKRHGSKQGNKASRYSFEVLSLLSSQELSEANSNLNNCNVSTDTTRSQSSSNFWNQSATIDEYRALIGEDLLGLLQTARTMLRSKSSNKKAHLRRSESLKYPSEKPKKVLIESHKSYPILPTSLVRSRGQSEKRLEKSEPIYEKRITHQEVPKSPVQTEKHLKSVMLPDMAQELLSNYHTVQNEYKEQKQYLHQFPNDVIGKLEAIMKDKEKPGTPAYNLLNDMKAKLSQTSIGRPCEPQPVWGDIAQDGVSDTVRVDRLLNPAAVTYTKGEYKDLFGNQVQGNIEKYLVYSGYETAGKDQDKAASDTFEEDGAVDNSKHYAYTIPYENELEGYKFSHGETRTGNLQTPRRQAFTLMTVITTAKRMHVKGCTCVKICNCNTSLHQAGHSVVIGDGNKVKFEAIDLLETERPKQAIKTIPTKIFEVTPPEKFGQYKAEFMSQLAELQAQYDEKAKAHAKLLPKAVKAPKGIDVYGNKKFKQRDTSQINDAALECQRSREDLPLKAHPRSMPISHIFNLKEFMASNVILQEGNNRIMVKEQKVEPKRKKHLKEEPIQWKLPAPGDASSSDVIDLDKYSSGDELEIKRSDSELSFGQGGGSELGSIKDKSLKNVPSDNMSATVELQETVGPKKEKKKSIILKKKNTNNTPNITILAQKAPKIRKLKLPVIKCSCICPQCVMHRHEGCDAMIEWGFASNLMGKPLGERRILEFPTCTCEKYVQPVQSDEVDTTPLNVRRARNALKSKLLLTKPEIFTLFVSTVRLCEELTRKTFFDMSKMNLSTLEAVCENLNRQRIELACYINGLFRDTIKINYCVKFQNVKKGYYCQKETDWDVYNISNTPKFLRMIRYLIETSLRILLLRSLSDLENYIVKSGRLAIAMGNDFEWVYEIRSRIFDESRHNYPSLFILDLKIGPEGPFYSTSIDTHIEKLQSLIDKAAMVCHNVPLIDMDVNEKLHYKTPISYNCYGMGELEVVQTKFLIEYVMRKLEIVLNSFRKRWGVYQDFFCMDLHSQIEQIMEKCTYSQELEFELSRQYTLLDEYQYIIPEVTNIGPFAIVTAKIKYYLLEKRTELINGLLNAYSAKLRKKTKEIIAKYNETYQKVQEKTRNIEHLVNQREWMETIPRYFSEIEESIYRHLKEYDIFDRFHHNLLDEDLNMKWMVIGWPEKILEAIHDQQEIFDDDIAVFRKIQSEDEVAIQERIEHLSKSIAAVQLQDEKTKVHEIAQEVSKIWKLLRDTVDWGRVLNNRQRLFGDKVTPFTELTTLTKTFTPFKNLWATASDWLQTADMFLDNPIMNIDPSTIEGIVNEHAKTMTKCIKLFSEIPACLKIAETIKELIEEFKPHIPIIQALCAKGMRKRHWEEFQTMTGIPINWTPALTYKECINLGVHECGEALVVISDQAKKEYVIEVAIDKMVAEWENCLAQFSPFKNSDTYIFKLSDEVFQMLEDHIETTQSLQFSPSKGPFEGILEEWAKKLTMTQKILEKWVLCQQNFMYLYPIFTSVDISTQLVHESKKFANVLRMWRKLMTDFRANPQVMNACCDHKVHDLIGNCIRAMNLILSGLNQYLHIKRNGFPRFYFLSDEELVEILSKCSDPLAVQPHLKKCFENIYSLSFDSKNNITAMFSGEDEEVKLKYELKPTGSVDNWLSDVERLMRETIQTRIIGALNAFTQKKVKSDRNSWVLNWPGQVIIVSSQIIWTNNVEICITKGNLHSYYVTQLGYLDNLRSLIRGELTKLQRLSVSALIVIDVHARDVTEMLLKKIILDVHEFDWSKQLRFYFIQNTVALRAINAEFPYGYEYLGNTGRLVITPLTDRCYLTLIGALHLKFGGAPAGPAGTGKTETTKDLAKAFAVQCVVFNCSDQLNFMAMGKFFKGLATCGAWACFDEFNRIDIEVLSVVAQQITTIQRAQMARQETFIFEGEEISLKPSCAVFVTMNPGYAGRTELPDNLKALFRPVAMMVPDYTLIAEISLFSFGFTEARLLAAKITSTFKLSSEQLSTQDHYDFGMRAVKTVIAVAGNLKKEDPQFNETLIVLRALKDVNIPKFLSDDLKLFTNILSDLFPNVVDPPIDYGVFQKTIEHILDSMILYKSPQYIIKVIQLYDTTVVRHGLMLVGPAGTGKTRCYRVLQSVMGKLKGTNSHSGGTFQNVEVSIINPKAINMGQIYGEYDLQTHEWSDGVLAKFMREGAAAADEIKRWYMFDGPVDAVWIENMNTLLDDNKKLCLTSGEIIKMTDKMTMMFEVSDLSVASPATVSRCGMVYLEPSMITLDMLINCWSKSIPKDASHISISLDLAIRRYMLPAISFLRSNLHEIVKSTDCGLMSSALKLIGYFLRPFAPEQGKMPPADKVQVHLKKLATMWVIWSTIWSIGATCNLNEREKFSVLMNKLIHKNDKELKFPKFFVYDYWIHDGGFSMLTDSGDLEKPRWMHWLANVPLYEIPPASRFIDIEVPTIDSIRNATVLGKLIENNQHVLVIGPTGSGKTITILSKINRNMPEQFVSDFMTFTAKTSLNQTRDTIESKLEKRKKLVLGPPVGKKGILFIDDFNMPAIEKFGAQPPLELIRQYMDFGGWYDTKIVGAFKHVDDMCLIGAMGPPGGGRNKISERLVRHFHLLAYPEFSHNCRKIIFGTILNYWMANMRGFLKVGEKILDMTLKLYNVIEKELLPTPKKTHYTYNLRDLSRVFQGILLANSDDIKTIEELLVLWIHECTRVFSDRLINNEDKQWFKKKIRHEIDEAFQMDYNFLTTHDPILFGDFMSFLDTSNYVQITDFEKLSSVMNSYLQSYNKTSTAPMSLVLFMDAIEHVCRIVRIIKQPQTNGLLLGIGGSGRRSLTKLSAFMTDHTCVTVEPTRSYGVAEWRDDLKKMMYYSGVNNRETVFLFSDSQIIHESFLEDINSMLNTGDVPNIYLPEDLDKIYAAMRNVVIDSGLAVTKANLFSHYLKSARTNLHIIFTMSPIGENFRSRLRQFPALINCCTIDWFNLWPDTALETVAAQYVKTCGYFTNESNELIDGVVHSCKFIHLSVVKMADLFFEEYGRRTYISPTKYLILLHTYVNLMFKTRNSDEELLGRYHTGLEKLLITAEEVNELREAIKDMQPVLKESRRRAMEVAEKIDNDRMEAEKTKVIVAEEEAKAQVAQEETTQYAAETEKDLEKAMPTLRKAEAALMSINKKDITEVKAMKRPPAPVVLVMEVLCLIKNIPPNKIPGKLPGERVWDYWEPARNMLSDPGLFLKSLLEFDRDSMTEETIKKIEPYIKNPKFTAKNIKAASIACKSLFTWISAIYDYYFINKTVAPKRAAYNEAKNKLEECQRALERSRFRMKKVMDGLVELEARLAKTQARVQTLEENEQNGIMKLELAEELLVSLDDEKKRWIENASQITSSALTQIGNLLICAATVAYFGPFSDDYRRALQIEWTRTLTALKVPNDSDLEPVHILSNPLEIRRWQLSGLPKDFSSTENAILSSSSLRFPLFIDPTGQANKWIKGTLRETRLIVQKFGTKELMRELEGAISFGRTILIENIGLDIDPILDPILNKQIFPYRGNDCVKFGENIIPFNDRFMIYFTTRLRNPTYSPEICSKVNIINFTLSIGGLEDQLLSLVVSCKRPDLEEQKSRLVESTAEMKIEIKNLEDKILNLISSATGSPLDDLNLIEALKQSKEKSENIREKVDVASKTAKSIDETRIGYAPVARRAQILYFCLADMAKVDPMYQYSLDWFTNIFTLSLTQTEKSTNSEERNISVNNHFTYSLFMNVSRSLFEKNRLQFTFLICIRIMIEKKQITKEEFEFFLTGGKPKKTIPAPSGFPEQRWMEILGLETLPQFEVLINTIVANSDEWKFLIDDPNPYKQHFPMSFHLKLSVFQRLMLIRFARPDKLIDSIQDYISSHIGTKYIEPLPKNVASLYTDSTPLTPLLFVLSPGTDPAADFLSFAEKQSMVKKVMAISLGQGQGPIAEEMFNKAVQIGGWIFFQNCHLAPSWMPRLEQLIEGLPFDFVHKDFRIWLTSTPSEYFPSSILENGNKMTIEPPRGVKANLLRAYTGHVMEYQDFINSEEPKAPIFKGLLFALCLFHAIVLERRKFGPLGFNIPYEFTDGDLRISINQLHMFVMEYESIPYKVLSHTAGDINYGGRVTDDWDRRCIRCLLSEFYNPKTQTENYMFDLFAYYYQLPFNSQLSNYMAYIKELPINDETTLFGLHSNANISYSQGEASEAIKMLLSLQPQKTGKAAATQDAKVAVIAKETLLTVPGPFMDLDKIQEKYPVMYEESLNTVLYQEILRYNRLLFVIQESCHDLLKALDGVVVMSEHLEKMSQSLYLNQVPEMWAIKCYPSLMPLAAWCKDLKKRIRFLKKWIDSGRPANFWISGFFFPQAFLTAILQNYARTHIVSVDAISYLFIFLDELPRERKADGCVIYGLFLEGARWIQEKYKLSESVRKILFTEMSPIWLRPNENVIKDVVQVYNCPVYKTLKRVGTLSTTGHSTNYVLTIDLPTKKTNAHWVLRGVALFCALDYC